MNPFNFGSVANVTVFDSDGPTPSLIFTGSDLLSDGIFSYTPGDASAVSIYSSPAEISSLLELPAASSPTLYFLQGGVKRLHQAVKGPAGFTISEVVTAEQVAVPFENVVSMQVMGDSLFAISGSQLRRVQANDNTATIVRNFDPNSTGLDYGLGQLTKIDFGSGPRLVFVADNRAITPQASNGRELWISDGSAAGTVMLVDINTQRDGSRRTMGSDPERLTVVGNTLYFTADNGLLGRELFKTDGTAIGTQLVKDIDQNGLAFPASMSS